MAANATLRDTQSLTHKVWGEKQGKKTKKTIVVKCQVVTNSLKHTQELVWKVTKAGRHLQGFSGTLV